MEYLFKENTGILNGREEFEKVLYEEFIINYSSGSAEVVEDKTEEPVKDKYNDIINSFVETYIDNLALKDDEYISSNSDKFIKERKAEIIKNLTQVPVTVEDDDEKKKFVSMLNVLALTKNDTFNKNKVDETTYKGIVEPYYKKHEAQLLHLIKEYEDEMLTNKTFPLEKLAIINLLIREGSEKYYQEPFYNYGYLEAKNQTSILLDHVSFIETNFKTLKQTRKFTASDKVKSIEKISEETKQTGGEIISGIAAAGAAIKSAIPGAALAVQSALLSPLFYGPALAGVSIYGGYKALKYTANKVEFLNHYETGAEKSELEILKNIKQTLREIVNINRKHHEVNNPYKSIEYEATPFNARVPRESKISSNDDKYYKQRVYKKIGSSKEDIDSDIINLGNTLEERKIVNKLSNINKISKIETKLPTLSETIQHVIKKVKNSEKIQNEFADDKIYNSNEITKICSNYIGYLNKQLKTIATESDNLSVWELFDKLYKQEIYKIEDQKVKISDAFIDCVIYNTSEQNPMLNDELTRIRQKINERDLEKELGEARVLLKETEQLSEVNEDSVKITPGGIAFNIKRGGGDEDNSIEIQKELHDIINSCFKHVLLSQVLLLIKSNVSFPDVPTREDFLKTSEKVKELDVKHEYCKDVYELLKEYGCNYVNIPILYELPVSLEEYEEVTDLKEFRSYVKNNNGGSGESSPYFILLDKQELQYSEILLQENTLTSNFMEYINNIIIDDQNKDINKQYYKSNSIINTIIGNIIHWLRFNRIEGVRITKDKLHDFKKLHAIKLEKEIQSYTSNKLNNKPIKEIDRIEEKITTITNAFFHEFINEHIVKVVSDISMSGGARRGKSKTPKKINNKKQARKRRAQARIEKKAQEEAAEEAREAEELRQRVADAQARKDEFAQKTRLEKKQPEVQELLEQQQRMRDDAAEEQKRSDDTQKTISQLRSLAVIKENIVNVIEKLLVGQIKEKSFVKIYENELTNNVSFVDELIRHLCDIIDDDIITNMLTNEKFTMESEKVKNVISAIEEINSLDFKNKLSESVDTRVVDKFEKIKEDLKFLEYHFQLRKTPFKNFKKDKIEKINITEDSKPLTDNISLLSFSDYEFNRDIFEQKLYLLSVNEGLNEQLEQVINNSRLSNKFGLNSSSGNEVGDSIDLYDDIKKIFKEDEITKLYNTIKRLTKNFDYTKSPLVEDEITNSDNYSHDEKEVDLEVINNQRYNAIDKVKLINIFNVLEKKHNIYNLNKRKRNLYKVTGTPYNIKTDDTLFLQDINLIHNSLPNYYDYDTLEKIQFTNDELFIHSNLKQLEKLCKRNSDEIINGPLKALYNNKTTSADIVELSDDKFNLILNARRRFLNLLENSRQPEEIQQGGAKSTNEFQASEISVILKPGDDSGKLSQINILMFGGLKTEMYCGLFDVYNHNVLGKVKTGLVKTKNIVDDGLVAMMKTPDLMLGLKKLAVGSLKGMVYMTGETLNAIFEKPDDYIQQYIKLRNYMKLAYMNNMDEQQFIDRLVKSSQLLNPLYKSEISTYNIEQLKWIENIVYFYQNYDKLDKRNAFDKRKLTYAIEDQRNKLVKKEVKSKNTLYKRLKRKWTGEKLVTNDEFIQIKTQLNIIAAIYGLEKSGKIQSGGAKSANIFTNEMTPDEAREMLHKLVELVEKAEEENTELDDPDFMCSIYECTSANIRSMGEKFESFLIENANTSNLELLEMDMVDENAEKYLKLSDSMIQQYKLFTKKINSIEKDKLDVQSIPISKILTTIKDIVASIGKFPLTEQEWARVGPSKDISMGGQMQFSRKRIDTGDISSRLTELQVQIQSLLHSSNSILTSNSFISIGLNKNYENIYEKINDSSTTLNPDDEITEYKNYISELINKNLLTIPKTEEVVNEMEDIINSYTTLLRLIEQKNDAIKRINDSRKLKDETSYIIRPFVMMKSETHLAFSKYVRAVNEYYSIIQTGIDNYEKLQEIAEYNGSNFDVDEGDEAEINRRTKIWESVAQKFLNEEAFEKRLEEIEKDIPESKMTRELQEDNTFKRIFTLANDINIECVRAEEFFSIHRKENYQRLKGRGKTTKQKLKEEVKRISHIRSRMSKLEHNIIKTLESMISKRKKKVDVVSKKIVENP